MSSGWMRRRASTFEATGKRGVWKWMDCMCSASWSWAGIMRGQWKGALTGRMTARLAPSSLQRSAARATAAVEPEMTVWSGELRLAVVTISLGRWSTSRNCAVTAVQAASMSGRLRPRMAAMEPWPGGTADCMNWPRRRTVRTASAKEKVPAATLAEYSPREWPAA